MDRGAREAVGVRAVPRAVARGSATQGHGQDAGATPHRADCTREASDHGRAARWAALRVGSLRGRGPLLPCPRRTQARAWCINVRRISLYPDALLCRASDPERAAVDARTLCPLPLPVAGEDAR